MFLIGFLLGMGILATLCLIFERRPNWFRVTVVSLLLFGAVSQWIIASKASEEAKKYQQLSGRSGDGL